MKARGRSIWGPAWPDCSSWSRPAQTVPTRALAKRGSGLHHVALTVSDLEGFLGRTRGWLLVPACLRDLAQTRTAWLARPGVATLLEVQEAESAGGTPVVEKVELPGPLPVDPRPSMEPSNDDEVWLTIAGRRHSVSELTGD